MNDYGFILSRITLYASICSVLSLGTKSGRLFNLAAGQWVVIGGWLIFGVLSIETNVVIDWRLFLSVIPGLVGVLLVLVSAIERTYIIEPQYYSLLTLGSGLLQGVVVEEVLGSPIAYIQILPKSPHLQMFMVWLPLIALIVAISIPLLFYRLPFGTRLLYSVSLERRSERINLRPKVYIFIMLVTEIVALILIGGLQVFDHKGTLLRAEELTVVGILGVAAAKGDVIKSAMLGGLAGLISILVPLFLPSWTFGGTPLAMIVLMLIAIVNNLDRFQKFEAPIARTSVKTWLWSPKPSLGAIDYPLLAGIIVTITTLGWTSTWESYVYSQVIFVSALVLLASYSQKWLGLPLLILPTLASAVVYILVATSSTERLGVHPIFTLVFLVLIVIVFAFIFYLLRIVKEDYALVMAITIAVFFHSLFRDLSFFDGADGHVTVNFPYFREILSDGRLKYWAILLTLLLVIILPLIARKSSRVRYCIIAMRDLIFAESRGYKTTIIFIVLSSVFIAIVIMVSFVHYAFTGSINHETASLWNCLLVFFLGLAANRAGGLVGVTMVFLLFGFIDVYLSSNTWFRPAAAGFLLVALAVFHSFTQSFLPSKASEYNTQV